ncbi:MAG: bifunctional proline dehydrogenase/L-glutamate gamma-semialdehyde dehydrogenase, partial [Candidatus Omnitrophica bacterium]|nr:bifunctional proline dehydrogenase/L-glutamate gamma-semialdehyde dehydrogenase [Candidatus Omnitrophota bacterium]
MEELIREIGWEIFRRSKRHYGLRFQRALHPSEWFIRLLDRDEWTKVKILQYTHTLPFIQKNPRKIVSLLGEYLADSRVLSAARIPAFLADRLCRIPLFKRTFAPLFAAAVLGVVEGLVARRFFAGETVQEALSVIRKLKRKGQGVTVDVLGEMALCQEDTDRTIEEYLRLIGTGEADSLSVKLTNLYSEFHPAAREKTKSHVKAGLWKVLEKASEKGVSITIDMEQYLYKEITLEVFLELLEEGARSLSLAIQCYIPGETERDLERIVRWGKDHPGARAGIRLVKGANWDFDMALAMRKGRPAPLYSEKAETDLSFERNARTLLENTDSVQAAFGTHNIRSMAAVMAWARTLGVQRTAFEFQFLYGMIPQEVVSALQEMGCRVRFYVPYGDLITGLAYLVRRLLENSANGSFLRALSYRRGSVERLLTAPHVDPADSGEGRRVPACRPGRLSAATSPICRSKIRHIGEGFVRRHPPTRSLEDEDLEQLPGERNEYFYIPRGKGIVIVENPEIGREGVEEVIA